MSRKRTQNAERRVQSAAGETLPRPLPGREGGEEQLAAPPLEEESLDDVLEEPGELTPAEVSPWAKAALADLQTMNNADPPIESFAIVLGQNATLGNGHRIAGTVLGTVALEPGVTIEEVRNLMMNPHLCRLERL